MLTAITELHNPNLCKECFADIKYGMHDDDMCGCDCHNRNDKPRLYS